MVLDLCLGGRLYDALAMALRSTHCSRIFTNTCERMGEEKTSLCKLIDFSASTTLVLPEAPVATLENQLANLQQRALANLGNRIAT